MRREPLSDQGLTVPPLLQAFSAVISDRSDRSRCVSERAHEPNSFRFVLFVNVFNIQDIKTFGVAYTVDIFSLLQCVFQCA